MRSTGRSLCALNFAFACACGKPPQEAPTVEPQARELEGATDATATAPSRSAGPKPDSMARARFDVRGLDAVLQASDAFRELHEIDGMKATDHLRAALLSAGFAASVYEQFDLGGHHALRIDVPRYGDDLDAKSAELAINLAVRDGDALLKGLPGSFSPEPLGAGLWALQAEDRRLLAKVVNPRLELGFDDDDLLRATALTDAPPAHAIEFRTWDIPADSIDPRALLDIGTDKQVAQVVQGITAGSMFADFAQDAALSVGVTVDAPFHLLGLGPVGAAQREASALDRRLPADPAFAATMSWGDPKLLHHQLRRLDVVAAELGPFAEPAAKALKSAHTLADAITGHVGLAYYLDAKDRGALVLAAEVKPGAEARDALRSLAQTLANVADAQVRLAGGKKAWVTYKEGAVRLGKSRGDALQLTWPPEASEPPPVLDGLVRDRRAEVIVLNLQDSAFIIVGQAARTIASTIARGPKASASLHANTGLAAARSASNGCQVCLSIDPLAVARLRFANIDTDDAALRKDVAAARKAARRAASPHDAGLGFAIESNTARLGMAIPAGLAWDKATLAKLRDLFDDAEALEQRAHNARFGTLPMPSTRTGSVVP